MDEKTKKEWEYLKKDFVKNMNFWAMLIAAIIVLFAPIDDQIFSDAVEKQIYVFIRLCVGISLIIFGYATRIMTRVLEIQDSIEDMQEYLERLGEEDESDH